MDSRYVNFQVYDSMICSMSRDIPVKFADKGKELVPSGLSKKDTLVLTLIAWI